ncbi:MAG: hypothetical protein U5M23_08730 [Marinagarivorans sp.]|nr:hypothetical protein [Marinagarivorans sp.]
MSITRSAGCCRQSTASRTALPHNAARWPSTSTIATRSSSFSLRILLRLGQESEGWRLAAEVREADPFHVIAHNLGVAHGVLENFVTLVEPGIVLRMDRQEATTTDAAPWPC